jgi:hypothetical protein
MSAIKDLYDLFSNLHKEVRERDVYATELQKFNLSLQGLGPAPASADSRLWEYDVFISHASEDKADFVRPLATALKHEKVLVWYDEFSLRIGDSLRSSIDSGLANSRFGVVILSKAFFSKNWTRKELAALFSKGATILPVWYGITHADLLRESPMLADIVALHSTDGLPEIVKKLCAIVRTDAA